MSIEETQSVGNLPLRQRALGHDANVLIGELRFDAVPPKFVVHVLLLWVAVSLTCYDAGSKCPVCLAWLSDREEETAMTSGTPVVYPLTLRGDLQEPINRWLFLVKWLLLIPQFVVLFFLAIGAAVSLIISWFAILFTARYPRGLFDFNVGILRWWWRIPFYGYAALGTDKYPPFSLGGDLAYPADLSVEYPEKLNRWLVLVKWILVLPHIIVLVVFNGGVGKYFVGLVGLLTLIAGIVNLFTGKYPQSLFKLIMGMNRWSFRVSAYVWLMTDKYPPFSLD